MKKIIITGNVEAKPAISMTETTKFARFSINHNNKYRNTNGEIITTPGRHRVVILNDYLVDMFVKKLNKGTLVKIEGLLRNNQIIIDNNNGFIEILQPQWKHNQLSEIEDGLAA